MHFYSCIRDWCCPCWASHRRGRCDQCLNNECENYLAETPWQTYVVTQPCTPNYILLRLIKEHILHPPQSTILWMFDERFLRMDFYILFDFSLIRNAGQKMMKWIKVGFRIYPRMILLDDGQDLNARCIGEQIISSSLSFITV